MSAPGPSPTFGDVRFRVADGATTDIGRGTRLERSASLGAERRAALIREQSIIAEFESEKAIETLPKLLPTPEERRRALEVVEFVVGAMEEMEPHTFKTLQRFHAVPGLPAIASNLAADDPLSEKADSKEALLLLFSA